MCFACPLLSLLGWTLRVEAQSKQKNSAGAGIRQIQIRDINTRPARHLSSSKAAWCGKPKSEFENSEK